MIWDEETIGQRIRRLRAERGLTQNQLGQRAGLSEQSINRIETGTTKVLLEYLERLAEALRVTDDYLRNGDTHAERETSRLIVCVSSDLHITPEEVNKLKGMASEALKLRNNARVPLNQLEIESLLMVIRGG